MPRRPQHVEHFTAQVRELLRRETRRASTVRVGKHRPLYRAGDEDGKIYFIEVGLIKLLALTPDGKECLLAIHSAGDIFGELCLHGTGARLETAAAMEETVVRQISGADFLLCLDGGPLLRGFVLYLVARLAERQQAVARLLTVDSEHRLAETLLLLARKLGRPHTRRTRIEQKISHEELSQMVGTTRPRVSEFMRRFRERGLVRVSADRLIVIDEEKLAAYLAGAAP